MTTEPTDQEAVSDMLMSYFMGGDVKGANASSEQASKYYAEVVRHQGDIHRCFDTLAYHIVHEHER